MEWIVLIVVVGIVLGFGQALAHSKQHAAQGKALSTMADFTPSVMMYGMGGGAGVAIDAGRNKFAISYGRKSTSTFNYSDLVSVEVLRDGNTLQVTNRGSQVAGAAVGAVLLGPLGLLLGGLTGSKRSLQKVSRLSLKIFTNDMVRPVHEVVFFTGPQAKPDSLVVKHAMQELDMWHARFLTILRSAPVQFAPPQAGSRIAS